MLRGTKKWPFLIHASELGYSAGIAVGTVSKRGQAPRRGPSPGRFTHTGSEPVPVLIAKQEIHAEAPAFRGGAVRRQPDASVALAKSGRMDNEVFEPRLH